MALLSTQVLPDNTLEEFRIEFNKLVTDVSGLSLGNTFDTQIIFEGTTADTFETSISVTDPTADRSIVFPNASGNVLLDSTNIALGDNVEIQFGDGTDLKIYHDGSNSIIRDNGTGSLFLEGSVVAIRNAASDETMAQFTQDGAAALYHNNVAILATAATGISVTGDVTATDDLILNSDNAAIQFGADADVTLTHYHNAGLTLKNTNTSDDSTIVLLLATGETDIQASDTLGRIEFQAPDEGTGTDAILLAASISAISEGDFSSSNNATKLSFATGASEAATEKMSLSSAGLLTVSGRLITDDTTAATSTTDGSLQTDGGLSVAGDAVIGDDLLLLSDGAIINFGADSEVTLTHVHNDGLLLNTDMQLQFRDSAINIRSDADGDLDINADDEIELNSTLIDINGNVDISGTTVSAGKITADAGIDIDNITIDGTEIDLSSGNLTLDVAGSIILNADSGSINLADDSTTFGELVNSSSDFIVKSSQNDKDIIFKGVDNSSLITALTLDMSAAGNAIFNNDVTVGNDINLLSDGAVIYFGADKDVQAFHVHNSGLTLRNNSTGDDTPFLLTLQTGETDMAANDVMGKIQFQAPDEGTGTDAILVAAAIQARSEGDFSSSANATSLDFMTGASEAAATKMSITSAGRVGINTTSPAVLLNVVSDADGVSARFNRSSGGGIVDIENYNGIGGIGTNDNIPFRFNTNNTERVRITNGGDIEFKTDGVALKFGADSEVTLTHVHNTGLTLNANFLQQKAGNTELMTENTTTASVKGGLQALTNSSIRVGSITDFPTELVVNNVVCLTADTSDNIHVANTLTAGTTDTTPYNNTGNNRGIALISNPGIISASRDQGDALAINRTGSDGAVAAWYREGTNVGSISVNGTNTAYNTSSDYRLKENVSYTWDATTRLKQLKPARFNFTNIPDTTVDGFLAHEVSSIVPEAIQGTKDEVETTNILLEDPKDWLGKDFLLLDRTAANGANNGGKIFNHDPVYQQIDQMKLVPLLVKTILELEARVAALES
jgi:hypothetical protein